MSERLYYNNSYQFEFDAKVESVSEKDSYYEIILDRSGFYPESGGQNFDTGKLDNKNVIGVYVGENDEVVHHCEKWDAEIGQKITGIIDKNRRLANMRKHTGQHILSQALLRIASAETVGAHLGENESTIELAASDLSDKDLKEAEILTNNIIMQNLPVEISYSEYKKLNELGVRRIPERKGKFRLVGIGDFELTACGGTHCAYTGEIGLLKLIGVEKIRKHTRVTFLCGADALSDYYLKNEVIGKLTNRFTCHFNDLENSVIKLTEYNNNLKKEIGQLQRELMPYQLQKLKNDADEISGIKLIFKVYNNYDFKSMKDMALNITKDLKSIVLFAVDDKLVISVSDGLDYNASNIAKLFMENIGGRGGGNPAIAQVGGIAAEDKEAELIKFIELLKKEFDQD